MYWIVTITNRDAKMPTEVLVPVRGHGACEDAIKAAFAHLRSIGRRESNLASEIVEVKARLAQFCVPEPKE